MLATENRPEVPDADRVGPNMCGFICPPMIYAVDGSILGVVGMARMACSSCVLNKFRERQVPRKEMHLGLGKERFAIKISCGKNKLRKSDLSVRDFEGPAACFRERAVA